MHCRHKSELEELGRRKLSMSFFEDKITALRKRQRCLLDEER